VAHLIDVLFRGLGEDGDTVAEIARRSGLGHETVRRLWRNPGGRMRTSPAFFVVAAIARARGISLDRLAEETLAPITDEQRR
jgi:transcriptional regulator with XRE-family HTH domain